MPHKRNGKQAKARRRTAAEERKERNKQFMDYMAMSPEERLITALFGAHEECIECGNEKLIGTDCQTPHCKAIREEGSKFYEEVTEDHIKIGHGSLIGGLDY